MRHIFGKTYSKEHFTKEYRIEQTACLQRFVAYIADQGITVIVSTVNPYRQVRDDFKYSRNDVTEIFVTREGNTERQKYNALDYEVPTSRFISVDTTNKTTEQSFYDLMYLLNPMWEQ